MFDTLYFVVDNISAIALILYILFLFTALMIRFSSETVDYFNHLPEEEPSISSARERKKKLAFIIGGFVGNPEDAMKYIDLPGYNIIAITNDAFGFKIDQYRDIINKYAREGDIAIGISIGAKAVVESDIEKQILINPCTDPYALLHSRHFWSAKIFAPLLEIISWILGWLSFIPFIPVNGNHFSLAFFADQLWEIGYGWPIPSTEVDIGIILSKQDEFLDNQVIIEDFNQDAPDNTTILEVNTRHATIGDKKDAPKYQAAIDYLL